ncbi:DUF6261 family protein [Labilibaculum euxinus]|uniref:Uncharacterized protein n=1 Tax=Labilibaculum euxinus TaxID=2686357 RepID=A0A7M4DBJ5_9BACT|nr:DUF6261 family protein [Labilibaculum euxinus]MUP40024.1 hypothetical protein [Labilibaculum euxinus]MVB09229.1 hypothetical protein [Labilibaculum euxinus]
MTLIKKVSPNSRNGETSALLSLILKTFAKNDWSSDTYLSPIIKDVSATNTSLTEALKRLQAYSQMAEKDNVRDMAIRALFKLVEGYVHIPIAEMQEAALVVENVLNQYGLSIQNEDYAEESADVESLLNDLSKPDVVAAITKLQGVPETVANLDATQKDFENVALQQAEGESVKKDLASASKLKKKGIAAINNNLVGYMNTMAKVNPATYEATAKTMAELIDKNNELVKRRKKTKVADSELV